MPRYEPELTLGQARASYFDRSGLSEQGYRDRWVRLDAGPIPFFFPNTACRVRAVKLHDLHHVLTEYDTSWRGEAEIGAWEVAAGCDPHLVAWWLDLDALAIGLFLAPRRTYRAFLRGRRSRTLYRQDFEEAMLGQTVGAVRQELAIPAGPVQAQAGDRLLFAGWSAASLAVLLAPPAALAAAVLIGLRAAGLA